MNKPQLQDNDLLIIINSKNTIDSKTAYVERIFKTLLLYIVIKNDLYKKTNTPNAFDNHHCRLTEILQT